MFIIAEPTATQDEVWKSLKAQEVSLRNEKFDEDGEIVPDETKDQRPIQERMKNWKSLTPSEKRWYLSAEKYSREALPGWRRISGFYQGDDVTWPSYRAECLNRLVAYIYKMIRSELKRHDELPEKEREHRTVYWDPLRSICAIIDLPKSKLSSFSRESTGMSAHELVDHVRVKDIKQKMRDEIRVYAREFFAEHAASERSTGPLLGDGPVSSHHPAPTSRNAPRQSNGHSPSTHGRDARATADADRWALARYIKERRRCADFDRNTWAMTFNVPNYHRLYRACILHHRKTPKQIEMAVIDEVLAEFEAATNVQKNTESAIPANDNGNEAHRRDAAAAETDKGGRHDENTLKPAAPDR